jgi:hypothetical protein
MNFKRFSPAASLCALLVSSLLASSHLQAGSSNKSGNPYGNGTFFPDSGTFSAIVRGTNGYLGVMQFSTTAAASTNTTSTNSGNGVATIYANGEQFVGNSFGVIAGSTISANYQGTFSYSILVPTANLDTNGNISSVTYSPQSVTDYANGQFTANLYNSYPTQSFSGTGNATVIQNTLNPTNFILSSFSVNYSNTVTGSRLVQ